MFLLIINDVLSIILEYNVNLHIQIRNTYIKTCEKLIIIISNMCLMNDLYMTFVNIIYIY